MLQYCLLNTRINLKKIVQNKRVKKSVFSDALNEK